MIRNAFKVLALIAFLCFNSLAIGQEITVVAGKQYNKKASYQVLWGQHYRKEWTTPVKVQVVSLDTL